MIVRKRWFVSVAMVASLVVGQHVNAQEKKAENPPILVALGASVSAMLFESHDKIGVCELLADKQGATLEELQARLKITIGVNGAVANSLEKGQGDTILSAADRQFVVQAVKVIKLVQKEAESLQVWIKSKNIADKTTYLEARKEADKEIKALLGIK